jgi:hypothetical protein
MAAQQIGIVLFRALALYIFFYSTTCLYEVAYITLGPSAPSGSEGYTTGYKAASIAIWAFLVLLSAFLWTNADRLSGHEANDKVTLRAGNWVVRLTFMALGILICVNSITELVRFLAHQVFPDPTWNDRPREVVIAMIGEFVRLAVGLALIVIYRFDRQAALSAAKAVQDTELEES